MAIKVLGDTVIFDDKTLRPGGFTTAQRNAIVSPENGMIVYDTDFNQVFVYNGTDWTSIVSSELVIITTPTVTVDGSPSSVPEDPTINTSAFALTQGSGEHYATDWEVERTANSEVVFSSLNDTVNLTSITLSEGILEENEEYEFRARHKTVFYESAYGSVTANTLVTFDVVATPTVTVEGSPSSVPEAPTINTSAFAMTIGSGTHLSTDWEVERTSNGEVVFSSLDDTVNLTSITMTAGALESSTEYEFRARHKTSTVESVYGSVTANTLIFLSSAALGDAVCGGFYIGTICAASTCYAIIVAPNATGSTGSAQCQWKTTATATSGTGSCVDGRSNTYGPLDNATHPAGNWTATRTINGFSDWYLPARDELSQLYTNKGPLPAGEGFAGVYYWSSTENSATYACRQCFGNGYIAISDKTVSYRVRAVRREPI
jgi:hypothetical protein